MKTFTDVFCEHLSEAVFGAWSDKSLSISKIETATCMDGYGTLPGLSLHAKSYDPKTGRTVETDLTISLGTDSASMDDHLALDYHYPKLLETQEEQAFGDSIARELSSVLDLYGLDRENLLEHQGWTDPVDMPEWMAQAFIISEESGEPGLTDSEEIAEYEHTLRQIYDSGRRDTIRFIRGWSFGSLDDWQIVFMPQDTAHEVFPDIDHDQPLTFDQKLVLDDFLSQDGWESIQTPQDAADSIGHIPSVPRNMLSALASAVAEKTGIPSYSISCAMEDLEEKQAKDMSLQAEQEQHRSRGR